MDGTLLCVCVTFTISRILNLSPFFTFLRLSPEIDRNRIESRIDRMEINSNAVSIIRRLFATIQSTSHIGASPGQNANRAESADLIENEFMAHTVRSRPNRFHSRSNLKMPKEQNKNLKQNRFLRLFTPLHCVPSLCFAIRRRCGWALSGSRCVCVCTTTCL